MFDPLLVTTMAFVSALLCVVFAMVLAYAKRDVTVEITFLEFNW